MEVEQVTERLIDKNPCKTCQRSFCLDYGCEERANYEYACMKKLAKYETAEEEGRLVIFPCKPGDTIYIIRDDCDFPHDCYQSRTCKKCEYRNLYVDEEVFRLVDIVTNLKLFGITIFLTREEAEKALEKLQNVEEIL